MLVNQYSKLVNNTFYILMISITNTEFHLDYYI